MHSPRVLGPSGDGENEDKTEWQQDTSEVEKIPCIQASKTDSARCSSIFSSSACVLFDSCMVSALTGVGEGLILNSTGFRNLGRAVNFYPSARVLGTQPY